VTRRQVSLVVLVALVAVLVGAGIATHRGAPTPPTTATTTTAPTTDATAAGTAPQAGVAAAVITGGAAGVPVSGPPARWRMWSSAITRIALPTVSDAGPTDPGLPAGFARTPTGALVAAANLVPQIWFGTDQVAWRRLADQSVLWGDGARADLERRRRAAIDGAPPAAQPMAIAGFRYIYYHTTGNQAEALLRLWLRGPVNTLGLSVHLVWVGNDWRVAWDEQAADIRVLGAQESLVPWRAAS
jgi:hypothetical protein